MNILHISEPLYPFVQGGLATHTHQMAERQSRQGHDVTVLAMKEESTEPLNDTVKYKRVFKAEQFRLGGARVSVGALNWVRKNLGEFDIVHAHSHLYFTSNLAALLNRVRSSPPLLVTNHASFATIHPVASKAQFGLFGVPTYRWADRVVCYNETDQEIIESIGVRSEDIDIVPNGIDIERFTPDPDNEISEGPIIWTGRMTERKGVLPTVRAMNYIHEEYPELELHLYGKGKLKPEAEAIVSEHGLGDIVKFEGQVPQEKLLDQLRNARLYLAPTGEYSYGRGIMEALSCGIPTLSTNLPDDIVLGPGGVPVTQEPEAIAEVVSETLDHPRDLESVGKRGRRVVEKNNHFRDHIDRVTEIYRSMVDGSETE